MIRSDLGQSPPMMNAATPFADHLSRPFYHDDLSEFASVWVDRTIQLRVTGHNMPAPVDLGAHLRRSFLGALGPGASPEAQRRAPCSWDPPCALDVFCREQLRHRGAGLPKPYVLWAERHRGDLFVTMRIFGMANDWGAAASEALVIGLRTSLPWTRLGASGVQIVDRTENWHSPQRLPGDPGTLALEFTSPMDVSASTKPDAPHAILARLLYRIDAIGRWSGAALSDVALNECQEAIKAAQYTWSGIEFSRHLSQNRHGQRRCDQTLIGCLLVSEIPPVLALLLMLGTRTGIGRKTNEGLGRLWLYSVAE